VNDPEPIRARCPRCAHEYLFYGAPDPAQGEVVSVPEGLLKRECYECTLKHGRSATIWVPVSIVFVLTFPVLWMLWTHFVGPVLVVGAALWYIGHWIRKVVRRRTALGDATHR
jgi:hypothetical protein